MAFPTTLTNAQDNVTDVLAAHINNLEAKVGIDSSAVTTSLDYLTKTASNPGHTHTVYALLAGRSGGQTLIGGTGTTDDLILRATSGVGVAGSDIVLQVGNNGATEALRILYDGKVGIGTNAPTSPLQLNNVYSTDADTNSFYNYSSITTSLGASRTFRNQYNYMGFAPTENAYNAIGEVLHNRAIVGGALTYNILVGVHNQIYSTSTASSGQDNIFGTYSEVYNNSTGNVTSIIGENLWVYNYGASGTPTITTLAGINAAIGTRAGNVTNLYGIQVAPTKTTTGTITTVQGVRVYIYNSDTTGTGAITTAYGGYVYMGRASGGNAIGTAYAYYASYDANVATASYGIYIACGDNTINYLSSNLGIGNYVFGSNATRTLLLYTGTAPTTSPADSVQMYSKDRSGAGTATLYVRNESGDPIPIGPAYAEMYSYENTSVTPIDTTNVYHAHYLGVGTGAVSGFTFAAGSTGPISAYADYGGTVAGTVKATDVGHGLVTGDIITIAGSTNYNGTFQITRIDNDNFYFTDTWVADDAAGNWYKPATLTVNTGYEGDYALSFNCTGFAATANKLFKVELNQNTTALGNIASSRQFSTTDYGQMVASGVVTLVAGDKIWLSIKNQTDAVDFTIRHCNVNLRRL